MPRIIYPNKTVKLDSHCFMLALCAGDCQKCSNYDDCCDYFGLEDPDDDESNFDDDDRLENDEYLAYVSLLP